MKKNDNVSFIEKCKQIYNNEDYDYSNVVYLGNKNKVDITCPKGHKLNLIPNNFLKGKGCKYCNEEKALRKKQLQYIEKAKIKHNNLYTYEKTVLIHYMEPSIITCPLHGDFEQRLSEHTKYIGCEQCASKHRKEVFSLKTKSTESFVKRAIEKYGDNYDYSEAVYTRIDEPLKVRCKKHNHKYEVIPHHHLKKDKNHHGCKYCKNDNLRMDRYDFIDRCIEQHGDKYDYSQTVFKRIDDVAKFICPKHGVFEQRVDAHLNGHGCVKCVNEAQSYTWYYVLKEFIKFHGTTYTYDKKDYVNANTKMTIKCKKHGPFEQRPSDHMIGNGCPRCRESKGEKIIHTLLENKSIIFKREYQIPSHKYRFDFYLTDLNILIEYDGIQHYSPVGFFGGIKGFETIQKNDKIKNKLAKEHGYHLIRVPYTIKFDKIEQYLINKIRRLIKYKRDNKYFGSYLEYAKHFRLKGNANPSEASKYLYVIK